MGVIENIILLLSVLLMIGVFTAKFSTKLGLPALVLFIAAGMVLSRYIYFDDAWLTQLIGTLALVVILFEGGLQTDFKNVKSVYKPSLALATIGVFVTTIVIGAAAKYLLDISWLEGMLFGAIVGSTDAAAVFSVLGNKNIKRRLTSVLEAESGTNDPMAVFLTITLIQLIQAPTFEPFSLLLHFLWQMGIGLFMGLLMGKFSVWVINKINLDSSGLYPVLSIALAIFAFSTTTIFNASGFLAVYVMAVLIGNAELTYRHSIIGFNEGFAWMMQIVMFILLGLLVFPKDLLVVAWQGIVLAVLLMVVARPVGVFASLVFSRFDVREKLFISWAGLKGAVPIILATYPLVEGLENSQLIFNAVFFVVLTSALVQGAAISPVAQYLKVMGTSKKIQAPHSLELVSMGKTNSEMMELQINEETYVAYKEIQDIELPPHTLITAVIRGSKLITPYGGTVLKPEDVLYILVPKKRKKEIRALFLKKEEWTTFDRPSIVRTREDEEE
ncbi:cell volume regulation protein A [Bacillus ectoiniformans]|uniref:potassium/proton antiporter n=1 Tax=Bacillus ectoiniformans TaxID=1494429 RepID=UPI00195C6D20|nr:potassium/proton antiporter [Bacillus ectoiniformans]MBM7648631.1 cell volume regulation protein A [Bacillus ectoiniformans]